MLSKISLDTEGVQLYVYRLDGQSNWLVYKLSREEVMPKQQVRGRPGPSTRARILSAAAREFAEEGFSGARVDVIARRAGANKAMLYYHVGDKAALYEAVLIANFDQVEQAIRTAVAAPAPAEERLRALIGAIFGFLKENPGHGRIMLRELASGASNLTPAVEERMHGILETVFGLLSRGVEEGRFRPVPPLLTHLTLLGGALLFSNSRVFQERVLGQMPQAREAFLRLQEDAPALYADLLLNGLARRDRDAMGESS
jgi:TetR/AcrR family transcriptional regulator